MIVFELADMDMRIMISNKNYSLKIESIKVVLYKLLCCIKYVHSAKIIHRDLKPGNILI